MGSSLNQIATLCWSPKSETAQFFVVNFSPPIVPVAEHLSGTEAPDEAAPFAANVTVGAFEPAVLTGIGWPAVHASARDVASRSCGALSCLAISSRFATYSLSPPRAAIA